MNTPKIIRSAHRVFCMVPRTQFISLHNINWQALITETECVYSAVRTALLNKIQADLVFKGLIPQNSLWCMLIQTWRWEDKNLRAYVLKKTDCRRTAYWFNAPHKRLRLVLCLLGLRTSPVTAWNKPGSIMPVWERSMILFALVTATVPAQAGCHSLVAFLKNTTISFKAI